MSGYRSGAASRHTRLVFERALAHLPFHDGHDWADARRGWLADLPDALNAVQVPLAGVPDELLHPSLQRIRDLRGVRGLFEVVPGVWQLRDSSGNLTVVAGEQGRILIDPPRDEPAATAVLRLVDEVLGAQPIVAVLPRGPAHPDEVGVTVIDGVVIETMPVAETPTGHAIEALRWLPQHGLLHVSTTLSHSLPPLTVDGRRSSTLARAKALDRALGAYRDELAVVVGSQDWPTWGRSRARQVVADGRDLLRYLHDEVLRLAAAGLTAPEVVASLHLPPALAARWQVRGYDASIDDYVAAIHPNPAGPALAASTEARMVRALGGPDDVTLLLRTTLDEGDYTAAVQLGEVLLRVEPEAVGARAIVARAYEQLAFQEESLDRRDALVTQAGALAVVLAPDQARRPLQACRAGAEADDLFDLLAVRIDAPEAAAHTFALGWRVDGIGYLLSLRNGVLFANQDDLATSEAELTSGRDLLAEIACGHRDGAHAIRGGDLDAVGDLDLIHRFLTLLTPWSCAASHGSSPSSTSAEESS